MWKSLGCRWLSLGWHCGETGHLSVILPGKKASLKTSNHMLNSLFSAIANGKNEAPVVLSTVRISVSVRVWKNPTFPSLRDGFGKNREVIGEWLTVWKDGKKSSQQAPSHEMLPWLIITVWSPTPWIEFKKRLDEAKKNCPNSRTGPSLNQRMRSILHRCRH